MPGSRSWSYSSEECGCQRRAASGWAWLTQFWVRPQDLSFSGSSAPNLPLVIPQWERPGDMGASATPEGPSAVLSVDPLAHTLASFLSHS